MHETVQDRVDTGAVISRDPEVHSGDLVFTGTRVPVSNLIGYLKAGDSTATFLEDFPTVERWQLEAFLELAPSAVEHAGAKRAPSHR